MLLRLLKGKDGRGARVAAMLQRSAWALTLTMLGAWGALLLASHTGVLADGYRTAGAVVVAGVTWLWFWALAATAVSALVTRATAAIRRASVR